MPDSKPLSLPPGEDIIIDYHQLEQVLPQLTGLVATEGNVFKAKFPDQNSWVYNVCDPDMAKHILVTNYKNYKNMPLDSEPSMADIGQLKFTEQVLDESMRLYPPVWVLTRQALADDHY